jgi:hypothetical protein
MRLTPSVGRGRVATGIVGALAGALALAAPASASTTVGSGSVSATINFAGSGIPAFGSNCAPVSWGFDSGPAGNNATDAAALNIQGEGYAGFIEIAASGSSGSECFTFGNGQITSLWVYGYNSVTNSELACGGGGGRYPDASLTGSYVRVAGQVTAVVSGPCRIDGIPQGTIIMSFTGLAQPTQGNGITTNITQTSLAGDFDGAIPN